MKPIQTTRATNKQIQQKQEQANKHKQPTNCDNKLVNINVQHTTQLFELTSILTDPGSIGRIESHHYALIS